MRKVFLDDLPRKGGKLGKIDWENSAGFKVFFSYDNIEGEVEIIKYEKKSERLFIIYNGKEFDINSTGFKNCRIGRILGKRTKEFKIKIGQVFKDDKRDLVITGREYRDRVDNKGNNKYYKYTCNVCGWTEGWILEGNLTGKRKHGCSCCRGFTVVEGINDIPTTAPWMVKYFQGGYNEAKMYTKSCGKKIKPICPSCKNIREKFMTVNDLYMKKSIGCKCGDNISYPEKFMYNILKQLNIKFETQLSKTKFEWCKNKLYDFYLSEYNCIIETHGRQHYERAKGFYKTLEEEQENDRCKERLAKENGIENYIVIDCRRSDLEWIKNSILNSKLNEFFDLSKIDWLKCEEFAINFNIVKEVCEYWNHKEDWETIKDLAKIFNCDPATIDSYLRKGENQGWIKDYQKIRNLSNLKKSANAVRKRCAKRVEIFKNNISLGKFEAIADIVRQSEDLFGVKMSSGKISQVCLGKKPQYKGFTFKYVEEL